MKELEKFDYDENTIKYTYVKSREINSPQILPQVSGLASINVFCKACEDLNELSHMNGGIKGCLGGVILSCPCSESETVALSKLQV